jgi:hypothetical protein
MPSGRLPGSLVSLVRLARYSGPKSAQRVHRPSITGVPGMSPAISAASGVAMSRGNAAYIRRAWAVRDGSVPGRSACDAGLGPSLPYRWPH